MKQNIRELLIREEKARKQIISPFLSSLGLTPGQGQARILYHLLEQDHITQIVLAEKCKQDAATTSRNIDKLVKLGFLIRQSNPDCRRSFLICLTEKGRLEAVKIKNVFHQMDAMICQGLSDEELTVFCNILAKICSNLESKCSKFNQD